MNFIMEGRTSTDITTQNRSVHNTGPNPYELPDDKEYHIFIACSGIDSEKGKWLLEQFETRYPFRCVYHERDYLAGVMIVENMRELMDKSVKSLLLISQGFLDSYHCKLEQTFAISISNETGHNCIIPVLLEDVPLPPVLRYMTYIDWRPHIQGDVVARIREAYCHSACQIEMSSNLRDTTGGTDNGKRIGIIKGHHSLSCCCGCRWKFKKFTRNCSNLDGSTLNHISAMCVETKNTLNSDFKIRCYSFFTQGQGWLGLFIACLVYCILVLAVDFIYTTYTERTLDKWNVYIFIKLSILSFISVYFTLMNCIGSRLARIYIAAKLREILKRHYKKTKCFIFHDNLPVGKNNACAGKKLIPNLVVIRYDTTPCKEYVLAKLWNTFQFFHKEYAFYEAWADDLIECTIEFYSQQIVLWEELPKSYYNRHNTWHQRECLCQLVEPYLADLKFGESDWVKSRRHRTSKNRSFLC